VAGIVGMAGRAGVEGARRAWRPRRLSLFFAAQGLDEWISKQEADEDEELISHFPAEAHWWHVL
jgi:hypothetical protein